MTIVIALVIKFVSRKISDRVQLQTTELLLTQIISVSADHFGFDNLLLGNWNTRKLERR